MQHPNTGKQLNPFPFGRNMPIGGFSYPSTSNSNELPSDLSAIHNNPGMVPKQGATSESPAVQSLKGPQTQRTSFLLKADATKPNSPPQQTQLEADLSKALKRDATSVNSLAQSNSRQWDFLPRNINPYFSLGSFLPLPPYSNDQSFSHNNNGNNAPTPSYQKPSNDKTVMTSDDVKRRYGNLIDNGKTKDFIKPMEEKIKEKSSSALPSQQLPATLRPTVEPQMTSTQFREYLKTIPGLKTVPKEVKDEFNKM